SLGVEDLPAPRRQHAHLPIFEIDHLLDLADQRARIAGQEVLLLTDAEHQRASEARADYEIGKKRTEDRQPIRPLEQAQGLADGGDLVVTGHGLPVAAAVVAVQASLGT